MKTILIATIIATVAANSFSIPAAAADDVSGIRIQPASTATPAQPQPVSSGQFLLLSNVRADALSSMELKKTRGAAGSSTFTVQGSWSSPSVASTSSRNFDAEIGVQFIRRY